MARNRETEQEKRLLDLLNDPGNRNKCGECKAHNPTWASWNLGVFLCGRCASAHRALGSDISRVKSLSMERWSHYEISTLGKIGNKANNRFWNEKQIPFLYDIDDKDALVIWLRNKYTGKYKYGAVHDSDYRLDNDWADTTDDFGFDRSSKFRNSGSGYEERSSQVTRSMRKTYAQSNGGYDDRYNDDYDTPSRRTRPSLSKSSSSSRYSPPNLTPASRSSSSRAMRLSYRKPTGSEYRVYGDQSRKMKYDMGFEDEDINIEALALARGNIDKAVEIIKNSDVKSTSSKPALPVRKDETGAIFDSSKVGGFNWLDGEVQQNSTASSAANKDNQIYQYVDPTNGAVYYIDGNGQQYVDPAQPTQQMMNPYQQQQAQQMLQQNQMMQQQNTMYTGTSAFAPGGLPQGIPQQPVFSQQGVAQQTGLPQQTYGMPQQTVLRQQTGFPQGSGYGQATGGFSMSAPNSQGDLTLNQIQQQRQQQMAMQMQMPQGQQQFYGQPF